MDIKAMIEKVFNKVQSDPSIAAQFTCDPKKAVTSIVGQTLSNDVLTKVIDGVKEKLAGGKLGGTISKIGGLFG